MYRFYCGVNTVLVSDNDMVLLFLVIWGEIIENIHSSLPILLKNQLKIWQFCTLNELTLMQNLLIGQTHLFFIDV